ncbi:nuclear transport factor 2 family protein [Mycobacterium sp. 663a-19]|uniref:nuclear transport factor 2 family protein n=1 Tax=Mycobacterium sp. 663a-19 TaxID=2986148 RepID=UPI002D1E95F1|nr:ketosteroid isomerase family protein [Mycobacterium sp. 663a-19]MEB3981616.1 nuclear transport factor 2 family protein [Mycobacterium sp. 663a-19]
MVVPLDRERLLAAVERSPRAVAAHDRDDWVGIFTTDARVEDPVGSRPHVGREQIYRFYDTFIGPHDITFHRGNDIVFGAAVLRDLELEVTMGPAVTMHIPAVLRYDLREANGQWQIAHMRAYWELPVMMLQFVRAGTPALTPALQLSRGLLANQGLRGTAGFMAGFRRARARHKRLTEAFLGAVARNDRPGAVRTLSPTAPITLGDNDPLELAELVEQLDGAGWTKVIGAGATVAVALSQGRDIVFADMAWRADTINQIRYFPA